MKKIILFLFLAMLWIVILFPKIFLWNYFVEEMAKQNIAITAKSVNIEFLILKNKIDIKELNILKSFKINELHIKQSVLNPLHVEFNGKSQYGNFNGDIALKDKEGYIVFKKTDLKNTIFRSYFKKYKDGMKYEFNY